MSNIHRINEFNNTNDNLINQDGYDQELARRYRIAFSNSNEERYNAESIRKETFFNFLKNIFCKRLKLISFTAIMSILLAIIYIISLFWGITPSTTSFLTPYLDSPILEYLIFNYNNVRKGEVWRWITYSFIHHDLSHVTLNIIVFLIFGSTVELLIGWKNMIVSWFTTGVLGLLFSVLINSSNVYSLGASACIYGYIGSYIAFMLINWKYLDIIMGSPLAKYFSLYMIIFFILIGFMSDYLNPQSKSDYLAHLGGFIFGIFTFSIISKPVNQLDGACCSYKYWFWISVCLMSIFTIVGFLCFYLI